MSINNEIVGISAEVAIANEFGIEINPLYRQRADQATVNRIQPLVRPAFDKNNIPYPIQHIAEGQNPVDFILVGNQTLSVKSNKRKLGKVAPQTIGQPTSETYFSIMSKELNCNLLATLGKNDTYENRAKLFKEISMTRTAEVLDVYWRYMFDCDYLIYFFNVLNNAGSTNYMVFGKAPVPKWHNNQFSFSKTLNTWNESCTLRYNGYSIGEFQAHNNRNCLKFRFKMGGLINASLISALDSSI